MADVAGAEKLFREHVYENNDLTELDIRQHRTSLFAMLADGESIVLAFVEWALKSGKAKETNAFITLLDQKLSELMKTLWEWHGPLEAQSDVPDSFKRSAQEVDSGKIVDLEL